MATINGTAGNDILNGTSSTDTINGLGGNDRLQGEGGNDSVLGGAGNDHVRGNNGVDWVEGGAGNDNLGGGAGQDSFVFREAGSANADVFNDFSTNWDNIQLDAAFFTTLGSAGRFAAGDVRFWSSSAGTAHDADDRIIYNTSTRQLWYDADGNGTAAAQLIGTLNTGATITAADIRVFGTPSGGGSGGGAGQTINGTAGNDSLVGGPGNDTINGLAGNDTIDGAGGNDSLVGGEGADSLLGGAGDDTLNGVESAIGHDVLNGGLGNDTYFSDFLADEFNAGDVLIDAGGIDTLIVTWGATLPGGIENLVVRPAFQEIGAAGNSLNNRISVESAMPGGIVYVNGAGGNDTIVGGDGFIQVSFDENFGNDSVEGGAPGGNLDFWSLATAVDLNFAFGTATSSEGSVAFSNMTRARGSQVGDRMTASNAGETIMGADGDDTLIGAAGDDSFLGEGGLGHPSVGTGNDSIFGGAGNDYMEGNAGNDTMDGGAGNDTLSGAHDEFGDSEGSDTFLFSVAPGTANADVVRAFLSGDDRIVLDGNAHASSGASGTFTAGDARFWSSATGTAHDGDDRVIYNTSTRELWYDADGNLGGTAQLIATLEDTPNLAATDITIINGSGSGGGGGGSTINGTSGNDTLRGTAGNDTINGLGGNDTIFGTAGNDVIDGGAGSDSIEYKNAVSGLVVDFAAGTISGGASGTMSFAGIERIIAGNFNDQMTGGTTSQTLTGQGGNDTLAGAGGADTLWGGGGSDFFVFREMGAANADRISDWASGADKIHLDDAAFTSIGALGNFAAGDVRFWASSAGTAHDANDRVIYNQSTGSLYYDADGSGGGQAQLIATVLNAPAVVATDIVVI